MKISAQFMPGDLPVFTDSVRKAEEAGYSRAWLVDGQLLWRNVFVYMTHGLAATEEIPFGTAVTNPFTRHYTVVANAHATLAEIYPGRVILGMGRGDNSVRTLGRGPVKTDELKEIVPKLRKLMAGETADNDGTEIKILWAEGDRPEVPIMMPATGPEEPEARGCARRHRDDPGGPAPRGGQVGARPHPRRGRGGRTGPGGGTDDDVHRDVGLGRHGGVPWDDPLARRL